MHSIFSKIAFLTFPRGYTWCKLLAGFRSEPWYLIERGCSCSKQPSLALAVALSTPTCNQLWGCSTQRKRRNQLSLLPLHRPRLSPQPLLQLLWLRGRVLPPRTHLPLPLLPPPSLILSLSWWHSLCNNIWYWKTTLFPSARIFLKKKNLSVSLAGLWMWENEHWCNLHTCEAITSPSHSPLCHLWQYILEWQGMEEPQIQGLLVYPGCSSTTTLIVSIHNCWSFNF